MRQEIRRRERNPSTAATAEGLVQGEASLVGGYLTRYRSSHSRTEGHRSTGRKDLWPEDHQVSPISWQAR
jgi:hypothetical protein